MGTKHTSITPATFDTFGELLRFLRERAELSQRDLAAQVGYHYSYLSRLEKNVRLPDPATLMARFVPALGLEDEPDWIARLLELARALASDSPAADAPSLAETSFIGFPLAPNTLLGREREVEAALQLLRGRARLVTLVGPPGVGKTRLSLHVAEQLAGDFAHGSLFVDLAPVQQTDQMISALMQALGVHEAGHGDSFERLKGRLHDENLLLVMDNFEQVVEAASIVNQLLGHARGVKMLVTSREALRVSGEVEFQLKPLPLPESESPSVTKEAIESNAAVQLFLQRARDVKTGFELSDENAPAILEICRMMDGLPLAIELAAARVNMLTPQAMLNQIDRRFEWLTRGGRDTPSWRRTLSGAVEWSYNLLSKGEKALLRRLSVFPAGWDLPAAEAICPDETELTHGDVFQLLLQLTEKSLAVADESELAPRWRLLETLRQFGHDRLVESGELDAWRARHLAYFADWAENIATQLDRGHPLDFHQYMEGDLNNLRAALAWALDPKANRTDALRLVSAFSLISLEYSLLKEGEEWALKMLPLADQPEHRKWRAVMLHRGAYLIYLNHWRAGIQSAYDFVKESERIARELGDRDLLASAIYHQYEILVGLEKYEEARLLMEESVEICRATGYQSQLNCSLTALGIVLTKQGKMDQAMEHIEKAIQVATQIHDLWGQEFSLRTLGTNLRLQKKYPEALKTFACSLEVANQMSDRLGAGIILANMSIVTNVLEDYHASGKYAQEAFVIFQTIGSEYQQAFPLRMMAYAAIQAGNLVYARELNLQSLKQNHSMGEEHRLGLYGNLVALAEISLAEKHFEQAARLVSLVESHTQEDQHAFQEPDTLALARVRSALEKKKMKAKSGGEENLEQVVAEILKQ